MKDNPTTKPPIPPSKARLQKSTATEAATDALPADGAVQQTSNVPGRRSQNGSGGLSRGESGNHMANKKNSAENKIQGSGGSQGGRCKGMGKKAEGRKSSGNKKSGT